MLFEPLPGFGLKLITGGIITLFVLTKYFTHTATVLDDCLANIFLARHVLVTGNGEALSKVNMGRAVIEGSLAEDSSLLPATLSNISASSNVRRTVTVFISSPSLESLRRLLAGA